MSVYSPAFSRVAAILKRWNTGTVTLTRTTPGTPDPSTPWIPGTPTTAVYTLDAVVKGVAADYVDETTILASDLMVVASPKATLAGAPAGIVPLMQDVLHIDGAEKAIKKIEPAPASGQAAMFRIFVAS